ncbi:CheR family methyltransferase [Jannaschia seohaensis]|uniref:protein-glutamate O-methyltransferase n=1 Tax=Jannaschia seohaensis TaxID=475081 RepID=A0A2Y9B5F0_9RHOB|nr:CheR family methyltransferase [Jannaschia seohaensis]PWJ15855.1 chemotaxis protein methyltransferase CheR [Jannaschia seohaensis]SSA49559.1 chemotaxis protein methyltransferase CheR [Jannaschia seohaensis]
MISLPDSAFRRLSSLALAEAGLDLQEGKQSFVASRLQKRLRATGAQDFEVYASLVEGSDPAAVEERQYLISALTTNVTSVFREPHHFALLARALKALDRGRSDPLRIWSAGCSTGEETLSMAMICRCVFGPAWIAHARILATDIDYISLSIAKSQFGDPSLIVALQDGAAAALGTRGDTPRVDISDLQAGITYLRHSLIEPLPVPRPFDIIFCRNVTIYFAADIQRTVQADLIDRLAPDGLLCLGHSERLLIEDSDLRLIGQTSYAGKSSSFAEIVPCR